MLLAFDVGNTNIVVGVFDDGKLIYDARLQTDRQKSTDEYGMLIKQLFAHAGLSMEDVTDIIIATVVPPVLFTLQHLSQKYFGINPIVVASGIKTGLIVKYDNPKQLGADRIVNAVAAVHKYGGPVIVIDTGTATTFCAVTEKGEYLGGAIAPGLKISADTLFSRTAQLPNVELERPAKVINRNTNGCMQSGLIYGHMGMVEYIVRKMKEELAEYAVSDKPITVVATGGMAGMIETGVDCIDYIDRELTLDGLLLLYEKNKR